MPNMIPRAEPYKNVEDKETYFKAPKTMEVRNKKSAKNEYKN
jgi:hypothetical protein